VKEDFLHYVWRFKQFEFLNLRTTDGQEIKLEAVGNYNTDEGPDFLEATVYLNDTKWVGSVEMHLNASDWTKHKHGENKAYNNVILHVVWDEDVKIKDAQNNIIPCLVLRDKVDLSLLNKYIELLNSQLWIPCQENIQDVNAIKIRSWLERLMIDRLEEKTAFLRKDLESADNNWEQLLFILIAKNLGLKPNATQLQEVAKSINVEILFKHAYDSHQIEAILFGQSGLLNPKQRDKYPVSLRKEYAFLAQKYKLKKPAFINWKLLRMRPSNFPTLRISQLASLYSINNLMFDILLNGNSTDIQNLFKNKTASNYWDDHYLFDKQSDTQKPKTLGKNRINIILINVVVPIIFLYGKIRGEAKYIDKSLALIEGLPAEKNQIISKWKDLGFKSSSAFDSQALIHLKTRFCAKQKCLQCAIGNDIMKQKKKV